MARLLAVDPPPRCRKSSAERRGQRGAENQGETLVRRGSTERTTRLTLTLSLTLT